MRVRVKDGFIDETVIPPDGFQLDMSGFTGTCDDREYDRASDDDIITVEFDPEVVRTMPPAYVHYCEEELGEIVEEYGFCKTDLLSIGEREVSVILSEKAQAFLVKHQVDSAFLSRLIDKALEHEEIVRTCM